ncbi:hypothetical protein M422DRAFT_149760, partial [Sphaerobolus stellatus SS14]
SKHRGSPMPTLDPIPYLSHIGPSGKAALWIGFVIFAASNLIIATFGVRYDRRHRVFYYTNMLITGVGAMSYFAMSTDTGFSFIDMGFRNVQGRNTLLWRQVFWARYIDWALTSPLILLNMSLLVGLPWVDTVSLMLADLTMVISGIFAGLRRGENAAKWAWYAFACILLLYILGKLWWDGRQCAKLQNHATRDLYTNLYVLTVFVWIMYPVVFALGDNAALISPNAEAIAYTVLDVMAKAVFGMWLLFMHKHDSDESAAILPAWAVEVRGTRAGVIQLPVSSYLDIEA